MEVSKRIISLFLPSLVTDRLTRQGASHAAWRAQPLVTVMQQQGALVLAAANAAARGAGLHPGQSLADARALCPEMKTVAADPADEANMATRLARWCTRWSPWAAVESMGTDGGAGLWVDASGCAHLFGGEQSLLDDMVARLAAAGFSACAAIADSPGAAWAASHYGIARGSSTAIVPEGGARQWLSSLPAAALRLPPADVATLHRLGLRRIGDLIALPRAPLAARFGPHLPLRLDQLVGDSAEPIDADRPALPYHARLAFAEPIGRTEDVAGGIDRLIQALCKMLERDRRGARRLILTVYRVDGSLAEIAVGTSAPVRDPVHLARLFAERLDGLDAGFGIEAIVLAVPVVEPLAAQQMDLPSGEHGMRGTGQDGLALLVDRLAQRLGPAAVVRQAPRGSHVPERSVAPAAPLGRMAPAPPGSAADARARPVTLMRRPEPIQTFAPPEMAPEAPPTAFRWRGATHRVARAEGPERIAAEWWHAPTPPPPQAFRDYWRIEDADGMRWWLFRDGPAGRWFLHGMMA
jgi:protein ImuB